MITETEKVEKEYEGKEAEGALERGSPQNVEGEIMRMTLTGIEENA